MTSEGRLRQGEQPDLVILVHGTFAGDKGKAESGARWWQRGSVVWQWLEHNLPSGTTLPNGDSRLFQWSGANTQTERLKAGSKLLAELITLERQGRSYHLVGHSHGGSVIWEALIASELARGEHVSNSDSILGEIDPTNQRQDPAGATQLQDELKLPGLRSWTTLGTPFLQFLPKKALHPRFSLSISQEGDGFLMGAFAAIVATPVIFTLSIYQLLRANTGTALLDFYYGVFLFLMAFSLGAIHEKRRLDNGYKERILAARRAMDRFHGRWLGIWAPDDEAINLLKRLSSCSADHYEALASGQVLARHTVQSAIEEWWTSPKTRAKVQEIRITNQPSEIAALTGSRTVASVRNIPVTWIKNHVLLPFVISKGFDILIGIAQGNNIPQAILAYCSPHPLPIDAMPEGITAETGNQLREEVSVALRSAAPLARELLVSAALEGEVSGGEINIERGLQGNLLVHTAYFSSERVLRLVITHIAMSKSNSRRDVSSSSQWDESVRWIMQSKEKVRAAWSEHVQRVHDVAPIQARQKRIQGS
ncbi:hypothetical protein [Streptomyces griseofuscus]|uniref:hypothetical protein n=1 Tax=Streptomyces griseofuscus TaxID=146922 RepID=UPI0034548E90